MAHARKRVLPGARLLRGRLGLATVFPILPFVLGARVLLRLGFRFVRSHGRPSVMALVAAAAMVVAAVFARRGLLACGRLALRGAVLAGAQGVVTVGGAIAAGWRRGVAA